MTKEIENNAQNLPPWVAGVEHRMHELDPELSEEQINIVRNYGQVVEFTDGEMLGEAGQRDAGFHVVLDGRLEIVDKHGEAKTSSSPMPEGIMAARSSPWPVGVQWSVDEQKG
ncbi:MAG: hypothetical protein OXR62_08115 [Ahrensia sp.]|nr:hypothetical protein [Ahrensia sp.]